MNKTKILIADDEADILSIISKKIAEAGYEVVTAKDGEEAWQKIVSSSPDVIVLDLNMPKKHGFDVLKDLRGHPPSNKWQPVIIVSGQGELEDMKKGFEFEADHYIRKPCSPADIIKAIQLMSQLIPFHKSKDEME